MKMTMKRIRTYFIRQTAIFRINLKDEEERQSFYLVLEVLFANILGSAAAFVATYAIRLGATNTHIGLLSSLPALMAIVLSIPFGMFLQSRRNPLKWMLSSLAIHRFGYMSLAIVPFLASFFIPQGLMVVLIVVLVNIPAHLWGIGSMAFMREAIPPDRRAAVISARNMASAAMVGISVFLLGLYLNSVKFPINYQIMFLVAGALSNLSTYFLMKVKVPALTNQSIGSSQETKTFISQFRQLFTLLKERPVFSRFVINTLFHSVGFWIAGPLYVIYYVRQLGASDAWIGLSATVANLVALVGWLLSRKLVIRWGEQNLLKRSMLIHAFYPIIIALVPHLTPILIIIGLDSLISPSLSLTHYNTLLHVLPKERAQDASGLWSTIMNVGAFICPMLGVTLANWLGIQPVLIMCGILALLGSLSFWIWPISIQTES